MNVQKIGNKFRARLQVPGDGRGGNLKRRQYPVPGIFDTAEDAAVALAITIRDVKASNGGKLVAPPLQNKPRKPSGKKPPQPALAAPRVVERHRCHGLLPHGHAHPIPYVACASRGCVAAPDAASVLCGAALSAPKTQLYMCVRRQFRI